MLPLRQPDFRADHRAHPPDRVLVGALTSELEDLLGNRDGQWNNEVRPPRPTVNRWAQSPGFAATRQALRMGWSTDRARATLDELVRMGETRWNGPATALDPARLPNGWHFVVQKTLLLARLGRTPESISDTFIEARGTIGDIRLPDRMLRVRTFHSTASRSGGCVVFIPGHATPLEAAVDTVLGLNALGHAAVCLAHPWTSAEGPARGMAFMRDVAAVVAAAQEVWGVEHTVVHARSIGATVGLLGALIHATQGQLHLDGPAFAPEVSAWLDAPWPGPSGHRPASVTRVGEGRMRRPNPGALAPDHPIVVRRANQLALLSDLRIPAGLLSALSPDLRSVLVPLADGVRPPGRVHIRIPSDDPFADGHAVRAIASALDATVQVHPGAHHLLVLDPTATAPAVDHLHAWLSNAPPPRTGHVSPTLHGAARDRSLRFGVLATRASEGITILPDDAHDCVYLTVPGLFTERYPGYMRAKNQRIQSLGLEHHMVPVDTDAGIQTNAAQVRTSILEWTGGSRPAILIGHSKGGIDIAAALAFFPELRPRVRAVITLQSPWLGSPIADLVANRSVLSWLHQVIVERGFRGETDALLSLQRSTRARFVDAHPWPAEVPVVCFASMLDRWNTVLAVPDALLREGHGPSDGVVPTANAIIPGSDAVFVRDIDHAGLVLPRPIGCRGQLDPGDLTVALLTLALERSTASA